jgi:hypothetical protein
MKLKASLENVRGLQMYQAIAEVATAMFGDKTSQTAPVNANDAPKTGQEAIDAFKRIMG